MSEEQELVAAVLAGSEEACRQLVRRYERPVFSLVVRLVRDPATAEDLTQEVFVKAIRGLDGFDPSRRLSSWLFKIAHNASIDHLRRRGVATVPLDQEGDETVSLLERLATRGPSPHEAMEQAALLAALERAVGRLRPEYREVVLLRHVEGLAYEEIAEVTGKPLGTVKTFLHRARGELARALEQEGFEPLG